MRTKAKYLSATYRPQKAALGSFVQPTAASSARNSDSPSSCQRRRSCGGLYLRENTHQIAVALLRTILSLAQTPCAGPHANCAGGIVRQSLNLFRQLVNFARLKKKARLSVFHDERQAPHARGHYWLRCHEGFKNGDREILV